MQCRYRCCSHPIVTHLLAASFDANMHLLGICLAFGDGEDFAYWQAITFCSKIALTFFHWLNLVKIVFEKIGIAFQESLQSFLTIV